MAQFAQYIVSGAAKLLAPVLDLVLAAVGEVLASVGDPLSCRVDAGADFLARLLAGLIEILERVLEVFGGILLGRLRPCPT